MTVGGWLPYPDSVERQFLESGMWNDDTVWGMLDARAAETPDRPAVEEEGGGKISFADLSRASHRFARALRGIGIAKGDVVAVQLPSCVEFLIAYFGVTRIGAILSTMHMPFRDAELEPLLNFAGASAIICAPAAGTYDGPRMMDRLRTSVPTLRHVIVARGAAGGRSLDMARMIAEADGEALPDQPSAGDPALLCFTSGTSAAPKGVMHSCRTLTANARVYSQQIGLGAGDRSMVAPPFTHIFALETVHSAMHTGGTIIPMERFTPEAYAEMIERFRPTIVYSAPAHLAALLKAGVVDGRDLSSVRQVILGGSICPPHLARSFEAWLPNGKVGMLFGMTEMLIGMQTSIDGPAEVRHSTAGPPLPGLEVRIVDAEGRVLGADEEGELQFRGFSVMSGYVGNDAANAAAFTPDGWFRSGDIAVQDKDGNITITGRLNDVINRGGVKINPSDIESAIAQHEAVVQIALVPIPDDVLGERICAAAKLTEGARLDLNGLCAFLAERGISKTRWPERLVIVDEMPMTPTRKIIKSRLCQQLARKFESQVT